MAGDTVPPECACSRHFPIGEWHGHTILLQIVVQSMFLLIIKDGLVGGGKIKDMQVFF